MDHEYFTFRSVTRGQTALRYLQAADISAVLMRTPKALATEGCGYAIRVRPADAETVSRIFEVNDVRWQRRFMEQNGRFREAGHGIS